MSTPEELYQSYTRSHRADIPERTSLESEDIMTTSQVEPKVWLITGASQGLGLSLALAALRRGHKVLATARQPDKARTQHPDVESLGGIWVELDVSRPDTQSRVDAAIREHGGGRIDVVVNNAGYDLVCTVEDML